MFNLLFILLCLTTSFKANSQTIDAEVVSIVPFGIDNTDGEKKGIHYEFIEEILKKSGYDYQIKIKPYPRVLNILKKDLIHLTMVYKQNEISKELELCKSIGFKNFVISLKENSISKLADLKNKTIGIIRNAKYEDSFDKDKSIIRIDLKSYAQGLKMLKLKRLDGLAISEPALRYFGKNDINILSKPLYSKQYRHNEVSKDSKYLKS